MPAESLPAVEARRALWRAALPLLVLLAVGALLFSRALGFGLTQYDDGPLLVAHAAEVRNPAVALASFYSDAFALLGPGARGVFYRPILWVSYLVDARIGGTSPTIYHVTNLALHLAACALAFALLRRLGAGWRAALVLALVLCVHPALVSVIGWIPCRNDSLLALAAMASVFALLAFLERPGISRGAVVLAGVALTMFTKESGVALLPLLPLIARAEKGPEVLRSRSVQALGDGVALVALLYFALRRYALGSFPLGAAAALGRARETLEWLVVYVGKTFLPVQLSVQPELADTSLWPGLLSLGVVVALLGLFRARLSARFGWGIAWYVAFLLPALLSPKDTSGLEHRLYVPLIGLLVAVASLRPGTWPVPRPVLTAAAIGVLALFSLQSARRLPDFSSDLALWSSATRSSPHSEPAWRTLAWRNLEAGHLDEAIAASQRALALDADEARSHLILGVALARRGDTAGAGRSLEQATRLDPGLADAWSNLALLQQQSGDLAASVRSRRMAEEANARSAR